MGKSLVKQPEMGAFGPLGWAAYLAVLTVVHGGANVPCDNTGATIYDYSFTDLYGTKEISLSDYKGKVVLMTNVASF